MSYNNGLVMDTGPNDGVSIYDVQRALGTSRHYLNELCTHQNINPMSKYKPVRYNKIPMLTDNEFLLVRYGLRPGGESQYAAQTFRSNNPSPNVTWIYDKPRGNTVNPYEPYRLTDFNRYFHRATAPFAFTVSGELGSSIGVTFFIDSLAAAIYNQSADAAGSWHPEYNISMEDLFNGIQTPSNNSHLCVCVHRNNGGNWQYIGSVISKTTVGELNSSAVTMIMFAKETTLSGTTYPAVPFFDDLTESGDTFRFIVGLINSYSAGSDPYQVLTSNFDVYSLAFKEGIDRKDIVLYSYISIQKLKCWFVNNGNLSATYLGKATEPNSGRTMDKYQITGDLFGRFETPSDRWDSEITGATIKITMRTQGVVGSNDLYSVDRSVLLPDAGRIYDYRIVQFGASATSVYLYIEPAADSRTLEFIGIAEYAYEQVEFKNTLVVSITKGY